MMRLVSCVSLVVLAACGGSDDPAGVDAPGGNVDAAAPSVVEVSPCAGESATVITDGTFKYSPMATTITLDQIVKFDMDPSHDVAPNGAMSDPGLRVGFGATKCLRFTKAGTFNFKCTPHGFTGSVTVN
jgi:plastocyanin